MTIDTQLPNTGMVEIDELDWKVEYRTTELEDEKGHIIKLTYDVYNLTSEQMRELETAQRNKNIPPFLVTKLFAAMLVDWNIVRKGVKVRPNLQSIQKMSYRQVMVYFYAILKDLHVPEANGENSSPPSSKDSTPSPNGTLTSESQTD